MNNTLELFYLFLEANGALIGWEQNFIKHESVRTKPRSRAEFFHENLHGSQSWIVSAFIWKDTPQGHNYWSQLNSKWHTHLRSSI